ncbi:MAG: hotdog fold thioesterase [Bacteroidota bacterium]
MSIWTNHPTPELIQTFSVNTLTENLGIEITEVGDDFIRATMPVDQRTVQPMRLLHGGASVALAETLGSMASFMLLEDMNKQSVVGVEINANHLRAVREGGQVTGTVRPVRLGRTLHVWETKIEDEQGRLACVSRLTVMVVERG